MADGAPELKPSQDGEELLRRSGIRCGSKRELEFALKSQSEFASFPGRTRSSRKDAPDVTVSVFPCSEALTPPASGEGGLISYKRRKKGSCDSEKPREEITLDPPDAKVVGNVSVEKPVRRFTRSALKVSESRGSEAVEVKEEEVKEELVDACSDEDLKAAEETSNAVGPVKTSAKKKLELKMSKKIVLENIPGNVRELLATGLLEGLRVSYRFRGNKV